MYIPKIHKSPNDDEVLNYIRTNGFGTLISSLGERNIATHIPLMLESKGDKHFLLSHISVANEQKACFDGKQELLAIIMNDHAYISSSWYDHVNVPTWNYIAVHLYGKANILEGETLLTSLNDLVNKYEDNRPDRFYIEQMSDRMLKAHLKGIVGFRMSIDKVEACYKLSQNRNDKDFHNVISHLEQNDDTPSKNVAAEMKNSRLKGD